MKTLRLLASEEQDLEEEEDMLEEGGMSLTEIFLAVGLFFLMVGVGVSCKPKLLRKIIQSPKAVKAAAVGVLCQFFLMPICAYLFTLIFQIEGYTALGFVLAGSMPGGSSSNVFCMWSEGVLELSVFMTILSTVVAFGMTPLWLYIFSQAVEGIDADAVAFGEIAITFAFLIVPLGLGLSLNFLSCKETIHYYVERLLNIIAIVIFIMAIVVVLLENPDALKEYGSWEIYLSAVIYFPIATGLAYAFTTCLKFQPNIRRTVVMEIGIQNLVLAFAIGERTITTQTQRDQVLPFPTIYAAMMYAWAILLVPFFRWQKRHNDEKGVVDSDSDFILKEMDDEEKEENKQENEDSSPDEASSDDAAPDGDSPIQLANAEDTV